MMVKHLAICVAIILFCRQVVAQMKCDGTFDGGKIGSSGIVVKSGDVCKLTDVVVGGTVELFDDATLVATRTSFHKEVKCFKCKKVFIYEASYVVGGVFMIEPAEGSELSLLRSKVSGDVIVSKGKMERIRIQDSCGGMDVKIEEVEAGYIEMVRPRITQLCKSSGIGGLLIAKSKADRINVFGYSTDADVTIKENEGFVRIYDIETTGDIEIDSNKGYLDLTCSFDFGDVKVSKNGSVWASISRFGSLSFVENEFVELQCADNSIEYSTKIEKTKEDVIVSNCFFGHLECVDNGGLVSLAEDVMCGYDKCDGAECPKP